MKNLVLIRHAKSSWKDLSLEDFDRPLNKRGKENAPFMAKKIKKILPHPDIYFSSGALRAISTANIIKDEIEFKNEIICDNNIYFKDEDYILELLKNLDSNYDTVYLTGHNPTLNSLTEILIDFDENIPTCGIVHIEFDIETWDKLSSKNAFLKHFEYPKKYL